MFGTIHTGTLGGDGDVPITLYLHREVARLVLEVADCLSVGETVTLASKVLPFELRLHLRFKEDSRLILYTDIEGDPEALRLERVRRALDAKCPKLATWASGGRTSILIFEADDIQHSNASVVYHAVAQALSERNDQPNIVALVETDGHPWSGWILKEGDRLGDDVPPNRDGGYICTSEAASAKRHHAQAPVRCSPMKPSRPRRLYWER